MNADENAEAAGCLELSPMLPAATPDQVDAPLLAHDSLDVLLDCDLRRMARVLTWRRPHRRGATQTRFMSGRIRK